MISEQVTLIAKVTNRCNMACRYCFIEPDIYNKSMNQATARRVVRAFLDSDHFTKVNFVWHGGEPLLRGQSFFQYIRKEQAARPTRVQFTNSTQTNGVLLDQEMLGFLLNEGIQIGLSLDGPAQLNDQSKIFSTPKKSAYRFTVDAIQRMKEKGLAPAAIAVVHRNNVQEAPAVYETFRSLELNMKINCLTWSGAGAKNQQALSVTPREYGRFLIEMFDLWYEDSESAITIEPFVQHVNRILDIPGASRSCYFSRHCHHYFLGISPEGDLFPCGMFQGEAAFRYGNIHDMAPETIHQTELFKRLEAREHQVLNGCAECAFFDLCYGGCMFHSLKNARILEIKDFYCEAYRIYFEHVLRKIHRDMTSQVKSASM